MTEHNTTAKIWNKFNREIFEFILSRVGNIELTKDILQEVFIKIHNNVEHLNEGQKVTNWIYQITRNAIIDYYRKKKITVVESNFDLPEEIEPKQSTLLNA